VPANEAALSIGRVLWLILLGLWSLHIRPAHAVQVWLQPWYGCTPCHSDGQVDANELFDQAASWPTAASQVEVIAFTAWWLGSMSDAELSRAIAWMKAHHVAMALEIEGLPSNPTCSGGIEGFEDLSLAKSQIARLVRLDASPKYAAMDEPLWGGHYWNAVGACRYSFDALGQEIDRMVGLYKSAFPQIVVGDIEPVQAITAYPSWDTDLTQFLTAYHKYVGSPLGFFQFDIDYTGNWAIPSRKIAAALAARGVPIGLIYRAMRSDTSDASAVRDVIRQFETAEEGLGLSPSQAVFGGWSDYPSHLLPDTSPKSETYEVVRYNSRPFKIAATTSGHAVNGTVTDATGHPAPGAQVRLECWTPVNSNSNPAIIFSGVVPQGAVYALVGVRVNTESASQPGANDLTLSGVHYIAPGESRTFAFSAGLPGWQTRTTGGLQLKVVPLGTSTALHVNVRPNQTLLMNSNIFPVKANSAFRVIAEGGLDDASSGSAYVAIFFMNKNFQGERKIGYFSGSYDLRRSYAADRGGRFQISDLAAATAGCTAPRIGVRRVGPYREALLSLSQ